MGVALDDFRNCLIEMFMFFQHKKIQRKWIIEYTIFKYFGNLLFFALDLNFFHKNNYFLNLSPTNEMNVIYSSFYFNLEIWKIFEIE